MKKIRVLPLTLSFMNYIIIFSILSFLTFYPLGNAFAKAKADVGISFSFYLPETLEDKQKLMEQLLDNTADRQKDNLRVFLNRLGFGNMSTVDGRREFPNITFQMYFKNTKTLLEFLIIRVGNSQNKTEDKANESADVGNINFKKVEVLWQSEDGSFGMFKDYPGTGWIDVQK